MSKNQRQGPRKPATKFAHLQKQMRQQQQSRRAAAKKTPRGKGPPR